MERAVAIKKLSKLLGKQLGYRVNSKAAPREEREAAKLELAQARQEQIALREQRDARYKAILAADAEYQALVEAHRIARKRQDDLMSIVHTPKITVGTSHDMFFHVKAEGDSWEEVIAKLEGKVE